MIGDLSSDNTKKVYRYRKKNINTKRIYNTTFNSTARLALHDSKHYINKLLTTYIFFNSGSK